MPGLTSPQGSIGNTESLESLVNNNMHYVSGWRHLSLKCIVKKVEIVDLAILVAKCIAVVCGAILGYMFLMRLWDFLGRKKDNSKQKTADEK